MDDPNMHAYGEDGPTDADIGRQWRENSSLEKWFPLTAERLIAQVNELRSLLAMCWRLLPDGDYGPDAVAVKQGLSRFDCWPEALERIADTQARRRLSR